MPKLMKVSCTERTSKLVIQFQKFDILFANQYLAFIDIFIMFDWAPPFSISYMWLFMW